MKLKAARDRKRATGVKVEGRKSYAEIDFRDHNGQMVALAKKLRRKSPKGDCCGNGGGVFRQPIGAALCCHRRRQSVG